MESAAGNADSMREQIGLSDSEARQRLERDGPNEIEVSAPRSVIKLALEVASEPMFMLLVACGCIYMLLGDRQEAFMLLAFVFIVMGTSFVQLRRSERALLALRELSSPRAQVLRDGTTKKIPAREVVVGDLVLLAEGDRVPADLELVICANLTVDESLLTGESVPVSKLCSESPSASSLVYSGTLVLWLLEARQAGVLLPRHSAAPWAELAFPLPRSWCPPPPCKKRRGV
jgi:P-type Ca2+ transporter type 2C